jgi:hypothetical protein
VVIIHIIVNTPPPPHNFVRMMDMKLRRPMTVQLQGTTPALTASHDTTPTPALTASDG